MGLFSLVTPVFLTLLLITAGGKADFTIKFLSNCLDPLWLAFSPQINGPEDPQLNPQDLVLVNASNNWSGMIWARTNCSAHDIIGTFRCETGDCHTGDEVCDGGIPVNPVTLANLTVNNAVVSYQINLNHGWNVPIRIQVEGGRLEPGSGPCPTVDCMNSILNTCPPELITVGPNGLANACMSACDKYHDDESCCAGAFSGAACKPSDASKALKYTCPQAHTYPTDNDPPTYSCRGADAIKIIFCPLSY